MKTKWACFAIGLCFAGSASAAYDKSFYMANGWSGEYPNSFSVILPNVKLKGRKAMDKEAATDVDCKLPERAVFSQWNDRRTKLSNVDYFTASKIVKLVAKENFDFPVYGDTDSSTTNIAIKKGDVIEYLVYVAEGLFTVRISGKEYQADQSLFDQVEDVAQDAFLEEQWLKLDCENHTSAWLFYDDIVKLDAEGNVVVPTGIHAGSGPGRTGYGEARDLTAQEAADLAKPD